MTVYRVSKESQDKWLNLGDLAGDGMHVKIKFDSELGMIVEKVIPGKIMDLVFNDNNYQREVYKKGALLGNTQKHRLPVASIPTVIWYKWKEELGDPKKDPSAARKWRQRLNNSEYQRFRTSEYNI